MAVDRGGLRFPIEVEDRFSAALKAFSAGIKTAEAEFGRFRSTLQGVGSVATTNNLRNLAGALREFGTRRTTNGLQQAATNVTALSGALSGLQRNAGTTLAVATSINQLNQALRGLSTTKDFNRLARGLQNVVNAAAFADIAARNIGALAAAINQLQSALASSTASSAAATRAIRGVGRAAQQAGQQAQGAGRQIRQVGEESERTSRTGNSLLFTFRRLFGVFAAFAAIRAVVSGTFNAISKSLEFNAQIEQARLGLAAVFTAVGEVRDEQGKLLTGAQAFVGAQAQAVRQLQILRGDARRTVASFRELTETFQSAIAPGLQAGLNLDQIRQFTVQVSQAAAALGIRQDQLAEEIRSILQGTIALRTTRLGAIITNAEIRRAKDQGRFFEFLQERFQSFSDQGSLALQTFGARLSNLRDAFEQVLGTGAIGFFQTLSNLFADLESRLISFGPDGLVSVNPRVLAVVQGIAEGLREAVSQAQAFVAGVSAADFKPIADLIGQIIGLLAAGLRPALLGVLRVFSAIAAVLVPVVSGVRQVVGASSDWLVSVVELGVAYKTLSRSATPFTAIVVGAGAAVAALVALATPLLLLFGGLQQSLRDTAGTVPTLGATIRTFLLGLVRGTKIALAALREETVQFKGDIEAIKAVVQEGPTRVTTGFLAFLDETLGGVRVGALAAANALETRLGPAASNIFGGPINALREFGLGIDKLTGVAEKNAAALGRVLSVGEQTDARLKKIRADIEAEVKALDDVISQDLAESRTKDTLLGSPLAALSALADDITKAVAEGTKKGAIDGLTAGAEAGTAAVTPRLAVISDTFRRAFGEIDGFLEQQATKSREIAARVAIDPSVPAALLELEAKADALRTKLAQTLQEFQRIVAEGAAIGVSPDLDQLTQVAAELQVELAGVNAELQRANDLAGENGPLAQFGEQFAANIREIKPVVIQLADFVAGAIESLSSTISAAILDAFLDPQADIRESFGNLFRSLAQQLLQLLIQALVVRAVSGLALGAAQGGPVGAAEGGPVPRKRQRPSLLHARAHGLARGGVPFFRPKNIAPSDTVPAWLTPGEFVMKKASVLRYGLDVMHAINEGSFAPGLLRSLSAGAERSRVSAPGPGFAVGGQVPATARGQAEPSLIQAVVVPSEQAFERQLAAGRGSMLRFIAENRAQIKSTLR